MTIDMHVNLSRRAFAIGAASAAAGLTIGFRWASAQGTQGTQAGPPVPPMIKNNPQLDAWVRVAPDGTVTVMTGRVELGQGVLTAMRQVAAEELDVAPGRLKLISGDTAQTPDEGVTAGSLAVKLGSTALGLACADNPSASKVRKMPGDLRLRRPQNFDKVADTNLIVAQ